MIRPSHLDVNPRSQANDGECWFTRQNPTSRSLTGETAHWKQIDPPFQFWRTDLNRVAESRPIMCFKMLPKLDSSPESAVMMLLTICQFHTAICDERSMSLKRSWLRASTRRACASFRMNQKRRTAMTANATISTTPLLGKANAALDGPANAVHSADPFLKAMPE